MRGVVVRWSVFGRVFLLVVSTAMLGLAVSIPASAEELSPWWGLTSSATPTYLHSGLAKDEVQEIIAAAPNMAFQLKVNGIPLKFFQTGPEPYSFPVEAVPPATAANVQAALESESAYGPGNVIVTGQGPEGVPPLVVSSVNGDAGRPVPPIEIGFMVNGTAEAKVVTQGRADGQIVVIAENLGDTDVNGAGVPVSIADKVPPGMVVTNIEGFTNQSTSVPLQCSFASVSCTFAESLPPYETLEVVVSVKVEAGAVSGGFNEATITGGGAPGVSVRKSVVVSGDPVPFGVESYGFALEDEGGALDTQAGSHPFQVTSTLALNQTADPRKPPAPVKDLRGYLPPGLVGNPTPLPQCTDLEFDTASPGGSNQCPRDTVIGVASSTISLNGVSTFPVPVFNMTPGVGEPARFGFEVQGNPVILDTSVRTGGDYGVTVSANNVSEAVGVLSSRLTFWGVPGDPRHDISRGWECIAGGRDRTEQSPPCTPLGQAHPPPFLILPTSCTGPLQTTLHVDSWAHAGSFLAPVSPDVPLQSLDGCNRLGFEPSISAAPDGEAASTPTGLTVGVHVPQDNDLNPSGVGESDVKQITVALPEGMQVNPAGADGLEACSLDQISLKSAAMPSCPDASKVGTVEIKTPLLPDPLAGAVYLAAQNANPFGTLLAMYIVAEDPTAGVLVKLAGKVSLDPVTGQLVATVESPQLPFSDAELHFFGSARAPLSTPPLCGSYTTNATFVPWSDNAPVQSSSRFQITSGPNGAPCRDPQPFQPGFNAQTTNVQAGAYSPFTLTMIRPDTDQTLGGVEMRMPPGLLGTLARVKLCHEPDASTGACAPESLIGNTTVSAGLGGDPFTVTGGKVFITEGYKGAPFGLSILNPAKAGPFDLGSVVVRAQVLIDPHTSALRIVSDPLPTILDGIPLQLQHVNVTVNRADGFTFNPTSCAKMAITGTLTSSQGATASVSSPFQVTNCAALGFKPAFKVSTSGKTSKANGASLNVKLTYPIMAQGSQANIASVKVDLPKQLPSRLTTLQKACTAAQFDRNPAGCPAASIVGHARATTPLLPVPVEGPAYFVSHGGEAFPSLIIVLQGYGVTVDLVGTTFISKAGITSSTFKTVPDVPVGSFELNLPQGKFSALTANGNLCKATKTVTMRRRVARRVHGRTVHVQRTIKQTVAQPLQMPTAFVAQNGAQLKQTTKIAVTGCPHAKKKRRRHHRHITTEVRGEPRRRGR
jgi:hypothetical protein